MEKAKTAEQTKDERQVRFSVSAAARRTLLSFVLYAVLFGRMRLIAGLLAAIPFLCGLLFFEGKTNVRRLLTALLLSIPFLSLSLIWLCAFRVYTLAAWLVPWLVSAAAFGADAWYKQRAKADRALLLRFVLVTAVLYSCLLT